jgi:N6-L-threonylcarbamoyladenine synthase
MIVLGIETSCDETAAAVVRRDGDAMGTILSDIVASQVEAHALYGGVVPEIAARAHVELVDVVVARALSDAGVTLAELDGIAATAGPGLIGGVIVGLTTAKALAFAAAKPLVAVNHLEGHALTARLTDGLAFPYLLLLVSGGHTQILCVEGLGEYRRWGSTIDDALGEAFDKTAKLLGLGYPGGPAVEAAALGGSAAGIGFPRPLAGRGGLDFSFSGLKTAVRLEAERRAPLSERDVADIAAAFQGAVSDVVADRTKRALQRFRQEHPGVPPTLVVAGGVAANEVLRSRLREAAAEADGRLVVPPMRLCTDNGVMIAWAGAERLAAGLVDDLAVSPRARWPLDPTAEAVLGHGRLGPKA